MALRFGRAAVVASLVLMACGAAFAGAARGTWTGTVKVRDGPANQEGIIEQSESVGGGDFYDTGFTVTTDGTGRGVTKIPNVSSGCLLCGHLARVRFPGPPEVIYGPFTVRNVSSFFSIFVLADTVPVDLRLAQAITDDEGFQHLDTWDDGSDWFVRLPAEEASWVNGGVTIGSSEGDLVASVTSVTSSTVTVHITHDPTPSTPNTILIGGLQVHVPSSEPITIHPDLGVQGTVSTYSDGVLLGTETVATPTFVDASDIPWIYPTLAWWGMVLLGSLLVVAAVILLYRTRRRGAATA